MAVEIMLTNGKRPTLVHMGTKDMVEGIASHREGRSRQIQPRERKEHHPPNRG